MFGDFVAEYSTNIQKLEENHRVTRQSDEDRTNVQQGALTQAIEGFQRVLFVSLATDIRTIEEAFCVLFVEFVVDDILAVFDGVCCGNQHVAASAV